MRSQTSIAVELIAESGDELGECPLWDEREGALYWVDSRAPAVKRVSLDTGKTHLLTLSETIGSIAFREGGGMLAATRSGLHFLDPASGDLERVAAPEAHLPDNRFNDGRCDRQGRFWAGTMCDVRRATVRSGAPAAAMKTMNHAAEPE